MILRPADIRNAVASSAALVAASLVIGEYPFVGLPLAAFALGWFAYRFGWRVSVAVTAVATLSILGAVVAIRGMDAGTIGDALFLGGALLLVGPGASMALQRWRAVPVAALLTVALVAIAVVPIAVSAAQHQRSIAGEVTQQVNAAVELTASASLAQPNADTRSIKAGVDLVRIWMVRLMPAYLFAMMGLAAVLVVVSVSWVGRLSGAVVFALPPLHELDLSFHLVWPSIAALGLLAVGAFMKQPDGVLAMIGLNMLLIVRPALFLQGIGVFAALYRRGKVGRFGRALGYSLLVVSEFLIPSASVLGLADLFFNLRKMPRGSAGEVRGVA